MTARLLPTDLELTLAPQPDDLVLAGDPRTGSQALDSLGDLEVGVWAITPGTSRDVEADEVFVVLSGRGSVRFTDGEVIDLHPGVAVRLRAGDATTWTIEETLRKLYLS